MGYTRSEFWGRVSVAANIPLHEHNEAAFGAWGLAESGRERCDGWFGARYNLWNTTLPLDGSWPYNRVGVQSYESFELGVTATARTLLQENMHSLLAAFREGRETGYLCEQIAASEWGTGRAIWSGIQTYMAAPHVFNRLPFGP